MPLSIPKIDAKQARTLRTVAFVGGGLLLLWEVKRTLFPDKELPGGNVDPSPESTESATITAAQASTMADAIEAAIWGAGLFGSWSEDEAAVILVLAMCHNTADVRLLLNVYGNRGTILDKPNLTATIRTYLSPADIADINADFQSKGITINF